MVDSGRIQAGEMVLREGTSQWVQAGSVPGLFARPGRRFWTIERIAWSVLLVGAAITAGWFYFQAESLHGRIADLEKAANTQADMVAGLKNQLTEKEKQIGAGLENNAVALTDLKNQLAAARKQNDRNFQEAQAIIADLKKQLAEAHKVKKEEKPPTGENSQPLPALNAAILEFSQKNMGKQVHNGECAMLAMEAIRVAEAKPMRPSGKTYIWGRPLNKKEAVLPGDIVQMEDCKFKYGASPHHTQIIRKVLGPGRYEILEQNVDGRRTVGTAILDLNLLIKGEVVIYRPLPKE
jgi:hypothetical protein